jgi:hypothetical protein
MPRLPLLDVKANACYSPHVVILGAGASRAAFPNGDREGRRIPLMNDFVDVLGLRPILLEAGVDNPDGNFEDIYQGLLTDDRTNSVARKVEQLIAEFFSSLQLPDHVTLYDELIVSLRPKDIIATFNWDPFLLQAYSRNLEVRRLPRVVFLHGNVVSGVCHDHRKKGFLWETCNECGKPLTPTKLLYPIQDKNYSSDPFIENEWEELRDHLQRAYILTIFGYSAPASDVEAKALMREAWVANQTRELAQISIVDIRHRVDLQATWAPFFVRNHYGINDKLNGLLLGHPRRSCDAFAMATLQQRPCKENRLPRFEKLSDLQTWVMPLVAAEERLETSGTPLDC